MTTSLLEAIRDVTADSAPNGLQLCAIAGGRVLVEHDTLGGGDSRLLALHCASKPLLALVAALGHVRGLLHLDEPLSERHPEFDLDDKRTLTLRHLFQHRAGLAELTEAEAAQHDSDGLLAEIARRSTLGVPPGRRTYYSVSTNWLVAGAVLRRTLGRPVPLLARDVLGEIGVEDLYLTMDSETFDRQSHRLAVTTRNRGGAFSTVRLDRRACGLQLYGSAAFGTARSLAAFYAALAHSNDAEVAAARTIMTSDPVRDRDGFSGLTTSYGLGVAVDVKRVWFGDFFSPSSYGASGAYAGITGVTDPVKGISVALAFADYSPTLASYARRRRVFEALFGEIELYRSG